MKALISSGRLRTTVRRLGRQVSRAYKGCDRELLVIGLLKGSFVFMADLIRQIDVPLHVDFMLVSSYGDKTESTDVKIVMDLGESISDRDVLLVEDIVDTGKTLQRVLEVLRTRQPRSLRVCTLLNKPSRREVHIPVDFVGVDIPDLFVCGYGLDHAQRYRELPYVGVCPAS